MLKLKKQCCRCKHLKKSDEFNPNSASPDGLQSYCKVCMPLMRKKHYKKHAKRLNHEGRLRKCKCSAERYEKLLTEQGGLCAVCGEPETRISNMNGKVQSLAIDHCHVTHAVRGLLCWRCNLVLGHVGDDPELLKKLAAYLENGA